MTHSFEVFSGDELVFFSDGTWIYPLFELERFLADHAGRPETLLAVDKIVGKAAAMMLVYLGIGQIRAGMMSSLAEDFLQRRQIPFEYDELVDRILCRTEELLADVEDVDQAYRLLERRAEGDADPTPRAAP
jgi:zinc transport system ATP-binding protein